MLGFSVYDFLSIWEMKIVESMEMKNMLDITWLVELKLEALHFGLILV